MKGLLLAGGHGTRLRPLTFTGNKHMLPIANKPMLLYGLEHLRNAGIREVGVVLGPVREGVVEMLKDGSHLGLKVTYIDQPEPRGLAHAVKISKDFIGDDSFVMYLGDNMLREGVRGFVDAFKQGGCDCVVGVTPVKDPSRFGVVEIEEGKPPRFVEKPKEPRSNLALVGVYVFNISVFDAVEKIKPSWRNELEITDAIQTLVESGKKVAVEKVRGWWKDTGKPGDLLEANQLVLSDLRGVIEGEVSETAEVTGSVSVGRGSRILERTRVRGPVIIGCDCTIGPDVYLGPYTSIGDGCTLRNVEIENTIVMNGSRIESGKRIVDSLIGSYTTILNSDGTLPKGHKLIVGERSVLQI